MKKLGDLMEEMGFRRDASNGVKEAFLKHLIRSATGVTVETPTEKREKTSEPEQLSFSFLHDKGQREKAS